MPLGSDDLRAVYAVAEDFRLPESLAPVRALLSDDELARAERFHFEHDRLAFVLAHGLTRSLLASLTGLPPRALAFEVGPHGKPELTTHGAAPGLRFNLSHTHGLVACAVGLHEDLGVDVEHRGRTVELEQVARRVFSQTELAGLLALSGDARRRRFFELWTLKESYIKAVGAGLSIPLDAFSFEVGVVPRIDLGAADPRGGAGWQFALREPGPDHQLAVAVNSARPRPLQLEKWTGPDTPMWDT